MASLRIILAESSDIMLNGISDILQEKNEISIVGKALRYNHLCVLIEQLHHDLVVLGPMITDRFSHQLMGYLINRFPNIKIVQINLDDYSEIILQKIDRATATTMEV
jgi:DNA-binding NarL/FixJ family response regulator